MPLPRLVTRQAARRASQLVQRSWRGTRRRLVSVRLEVRQATAGPAGLWLALRPDGVRALLRQWTGRAPRRLAVPVVELDLACPPEANSARVPLPSGLRWPATVSALHTRLQLSDGAPLWLVAGPDARGRARAQVYRRRLAVTAVRAPRPRRLELDVETDGFVLPESGSELVLAGARQELTVQVVDAGRAVVDLQTVAPFGTQLVPAQPGAYRLEVRTARTELVANAALEPGLVRVDDELTLRTGCTKDGWFELRLGTTRDPATTASRADAPPVRSRYTAALQRGRQDLIYLNCFSGASTADNVGPVAAELARRRPDLAQVWAVADHSLELPAGAAKVVTQTAEWWQAQASARIVVTNCWLPTGYRRPPGQTILQTWHGTPLKALGLDRDVDEPYATRSAWLRRHSAMWDLLLAQNGYSAEVLARAYCFDRDPLVVGYPRNDRLVRGYPPAELAAIRHRLDVGPHSRLVLYAPTFRDDDDRLFRELDLARLASGLRGATGDDVAVLVRGHRNTIRHDRSVTAPDVLDVTLYPDLAELFAVSAALVTDYSSAMFDYALTGRPLVFFVPDRARYDNEIRGTYFDLASQAPGPLVTATDEVIEALYAAWNGPDPATQPAYARWRERYLAAERGTATTRTVDALLALVAD